MKLTFLGTSAGTPTPSRNTSSIAIELGADSWVFDCGEGTQHRFLHSTLKMSAITKIFITHTHPDHILGLVPLLSTICVAETPQKEKEPTNTISHNKKIIEIYGPSGTRELVRTTLRITQSRITSLYRVNELLFPDETPYPQEKCDRHAKEAAAGMDLVLSEDENTWTVIDEPDFKVRAAPILHTIRCIGYVVEESPPLEKLNINAIRPLLIRNAQALSEQGIKNPWSLLGQLQKKSKAITLPDGTVLHPPSRENRADIKAVILGDTYDASSIIPIALDADVLVHECTNGYVAQLEDGSNRTEESVRESAKSRGHSTPEVAGNLANRISAKRLVLTHFSARYPDPYGYRYDNDQVIMKSNELSVAMRSYVKKTSAAKNGNKDEKKESSAMPSSFEETNPTLKYLNGMAKKADQAWGKSGTIMARDYLTLSIDC